MPTMEQVKAHVLLKLVKRRMWGGKHTEFIHVRSGLPQELWPAAEEAARELIREGFIAQARKTNQLHISLNSARLHEIYDYLKRHGEILHEF